MSHKGLQRGVLASVLASIAGCVGATDSKTTQVRSGTDYQGRSQSSAPAQAAPSAAPNPCEPPEASTGDLFTRQAPCKGLPSETQHVVQPPDVHPIQ
jgi:hypothetical protein